MNDKSSVVNEEEELSSHHNNNNIIIIYVRSNLLIINNLTDLKNVVVDGKYLVIQELLNNPFLVSGRKINMRVYFLIVCNGGNIDGYIHLNGFMYYTPKKFNYDSDDKDCHITTGYIDRKVYEKNPLTLKDFYRYLNNKGYKSNELIKNMLENKFSDHKSNDGPMPHTELEKFKTQFMQNPYQPPK